MVVVVNNCMVNFLCTPRLHLAPVHTFVRACVISSWFLFSLFFSFQDGTLTSIYLMTSYGTKNVNRAALYLTWTVLGFQMNFMVYFDFFFGVLLQLFNPQEDRKSSSPLKVISSFITYSVRAWTINTINVYIPIYTYNSNYMGEHCPPTHCPSTQCFYVENRKKYNII